MQMRRIAIMLFPAVVFFWLIGWGLFFFGSRQQNKSGETRVVVNMEIEVAVPLFREAYSDP
jgi:hypothetical protein